MIKQSTYKPEYFSYDIIKNSKFKYPLELKDIDYMNNLINNFENSYLHYLCILAIRNNCNSNKKVLNFIWQKLGDSKASYMKFMVTSKCSKIWNRTYDGYWMFEDDFNLIFDNFIASASELGITDNTIITKEDLNKICDRFEINKVLNEIQNNTNI